MKILYISHYFPPEVNAPAVRVSEMASRWAERGADVTVLTCFPNHPTGIIPERYKGMWLCKENYGNVKVVRTYVFAAPNKGFLKRILNYLSFMFSSIIIGTGQIGKPDVLIATSPQFFVAVAGYIISRLKSCKFVFEVRDIWPEEIVAVGALKNKLIITALEAIEMFLYQKADLIVAVASGTIEILTRRGIPGSKIVLIPNGVDTRRSSACPDGRQLRKELGFSEKFVVGYIGTHGMAHRLDVVLEAAARLKNYDDIQLLFVGEGAEKDNLIRKANSLNLKNVLFHPQVGREKVFEFYHACDLCLVPLKKADLFTKNIPSKIYEIMACGKPIIISADGESRRLVEGSGAGLSARPEDPQDLASKILYLRDNEPARTRMATSGLAYVLANSSRDRLADGYLDRLQTLVEHESHCLKTKQYPVLTEKRHMPDEKEEASAQQS